MKLLRKTVSGIMLTLLLVSLLTLAFNIRSVKASGTIYIRADGSIDPPTAPISSVDNVTYTLTGNVTGDSDGIVVERSDIILDGASCALQGPGAGIPTGIYLNGISNVTIRNIEIKAFHNGILFSGSSNNDISGNNLKENDRCILLLESSNYNSIAGNNITNNGIGIYLQVSSTFNDIVENNITNNNSYGLIIAYYSNNNNVSGNNITNNGACGVGVIVEADSTNNSLVGNKIANNYDGIWLESSNNSIVGNNITANNRFGIYLGSSTYNSISGNVFVENGMYVWESYGNVVVDDTVNGKPLVYLEGVSDHVVKEAGQVVLIGCSNITVENLDLSKATVGIQLWQTDHTRIVGNNITANNGSGIRLYYSSYNTIFENNITNNAGANLDVRFSSDNMLYHNNFIDNAAVVYTYEAGGTWDDGYPSGGNYWSNYIGTDMYSGPYQNETGSDGVGDTLYTIDANNADNYPLMRPYVPYENQTIYIRADGNVDPSGAPIQRKGDLYTLTGNITSDADGIVIVERNNMTLDGAGFTVKGTGVSTTGIQLYGYPGLIQNVTIKNMEIKAFEFGIVLRFSNNSTIAESNVTGRNNRVDIWLLDSNNNTIVGNTITNGYDGIWLSFSDNNTIVGNKLTNNYNGVHINGWSNLNPSHNVIVGNSITNNSFGIFLRDSNNNTIAENNIANNSCDGIAFGNSSSNTIANNNITANLRTFDLYGSDNRIYHNNFINNIQGVVALYESTNLWDNGYPSGGNYWSDYIGTDMYSGPCQNETNSDGIGDTSYVIDAYNKDSYPLTKPYAGPHDIGITDLNKSKTVLGFDFNMNISVKIVNYGLEPETFNVTVYANETMIGFFRDVTLPSRNSTNLEFVFNTDWLGLGKGNYSIVAVADPVENETDISDNHFTDGWVYLAMKGDLTGNTTNVWDFVPDGIVDGSDLIVVSRCFGSSPASQPPMLWHPNCDITNDNIIDGSDLIIVARHYGEQDP